MKDKLKEKINEIVNNAKNEGREMTEDEQLMVDALTFQLKSLPNDKEDTEVTETEEVEDEKKDETPDTDDNDSNKEEVEDVKEVTETETDTPDTDEDTKQEDDAEVSENEEVEDKEKDKTNNDKRNFNIKMNKEFKLIRAINQMANGKAVDEVTAAVSEAGRNEMRSAGLTAEGNLVIPSETRSISVTDSVGATVGVDVADILAPLRDNLVLAKAGAKFMTGLKNDLKLPSLIGSEAKWASEVGNVANDATASLNGVTLKPKRISVILPVSKQFLIQSSDSAEAILKENIMSAVAEKLQKTILSNVVNDATAPKGIYAATPVSAKTYKALCDMEAEADKKNLGQNRTYIVGNKAKAALRQLQKGTNNTQMVYDKGEVDGTPCLSTSSAPENAVLYGDFSNLYIGQFGGTEIVVDNYTRAAYGEVLLTVNAYFDAALAREGAVISGDVTKA
jgi:phage capsid family|nr:MAG TPA: major capsid protein [Caudoviricetes sp.]DAI03579.1 MAG TPA: major capsid protein [Caudoviricetes sp.]